MVEAKLSERAEIILRTVVQNYIGTAEPVGSRTIAKMTHLGLSPATIRNVMSDLEDTGYLSHPHTSAGRMPTDLAYRFYVNSLGEIPPLAREELEKIEQSFPSGVREIDDLMEVTSRLLSFLSQQAGLVSLPDVRSVVLKHLEFIRLRPYQAMAVFVSESGILHNRIIELDEDFTQEKLDQMTGYLNAEFGGMPLPRIRSEIVKHMAREKEQYDQLLMNAMRLSQKALVQEENVESGQVILGGTTNILKQPEFTADVDKMRSIFSAFEDKSRLLKIIDRVLHGQGVSILIGSENEIQEMKNCSLVMHPYTCGDRALGVLGVIGPTRMEYPRMMALVAATAQTLSRLLTER
ncbi:MAG TPA: heat-inducible transcriptional repressor HrcA [bacterium]|nr:heat-inducible transcriptional repressor HrcA [bacterium]